MLHDANYDNGTSTEVGYDLNGAGEIINISRGWRIRAKDVTYKNRNCTLLLYEAKLAA